MRRDLDRGGEAGELTGADVTDQCQWSRHDVPAEGWSPAQTRNYTGEFIFCEPPQPRLAYGTGVWTNRAPVEAPCRGLASVRARMVKLPMDARTRAF